MSEKTDSNLSNIRHSLSHLLASVVMKKYPDTKLGIGPVIENGFYYDFLFSNQISDSDLENLEKEMRSLIAKKIKFEKEAITLADAKKLFKNQPFKVELAEEYAKDGKELSIYKSGDFTDLCEGGHVEDTSEINPDAFKLTKLAGAYWRGDEKNPQLTRIYGLAFESKNELAEYLKMLEEAEKRDHKKLGPQLGLFMFHETAPGMPYWLPKGLVVLNELTDFWRKEHSARGYQEISSPLVNKKELWETSGHWEHYKDEMFLAKMGDKEIYGIKPMNCPNAMIVFASQSRSYKDLPLRFSDTDILHRYERSGTLSGLFRVRSFRQDDSHNFVTENQIAEEYGKIFDIAEKFYGIFGLEYKYRIGTRPEKFLGDIETWNKAESALKEILNEKAGKGNYVIEEGDGAFYGPKVDILMKDAIGREWQMGTIQLDFQLPRRFNLEYTDSDGSKKTPVVIHRVIYGSLDRFIGILIEHFSGAFPLWLSPVQIAILPISEKQNKYAQEICGEIIKAGIRAEFVDKNETIGKKIREVETQKTPYIVVIGEKEEKNKTVALRKRKQGDLGEIKAGDLIDRLLKETEKKSLD